MTLAAIYEKPSLRTRVTFEAAMTQLGGHAIYLGPADIQMGQREPVADVARNLSRRGQIVAARTFSHGTVTTLAANSSVPVINALSDREHPCQALADFLTLQERWGELAGRKVAFVGDGNNVAHSLMLGGAKAGMDVRVAHPEGHEPFPQVTDRARDIAAHTGAKVTTTTVVAEAATGADALYTDVWASMGQESEADERRATFARY